MSEGNGGRDGRAVVLVSHGTVDDLNDLPAFVTNVRRGRPPGPELVAELRRRYAAIGGHSPLNSINTILAIKLAAVLGVPVRLANRLWHPYVRDVLGELAHQRIRRVGVVPLAQHSAHVYANDAKTAAEGTGIALSCAPDWGQTPALCEAFVKRIRKCLEGLDVATTQVLMTAHSLPTAIIKQGDPYEREVRAAAATIGATLDPVVSTVAFQSQGMDGGDWLGPDLPTALDEARARGAKTVVLAPIGFLADHVEILYDLDIEAAALAAGRGLRTVRVPSLNADDDLVSVIADVARPLLDAHA
jgi:protoporphyrin/coproporphyrin ferrochelatase